jgi:hypothetical protein
VHEGQDVADQERRGQEEHTPYREGISGTACPLTGNDSYTPRHGPFVYFDDVTGGNNPRSAYCIAHVRPSTPLAGDLRHNTVARYNFITPNLCHDMHDTCSPLNDAVKQGDTWLSQQVPLILHSECCPDIGFGSYDRFFPSQDTLPTDGFGNLIVLPLWSRPRGRQQRVRRRRVPPVRRSVGLPRHDAALIARECDHPGGSSGSSCNPCDNRGRIRPSVYGDTAHQPTPR